MTRYFFNLYNDELSRDEEGIEFPDMAAAREAAELEVLYQAAESIKTHRHLVLSHRLVICDEAGELDSIRFGDLISVRD